MKQIALLDLDYFFAQCEQIRNPSLKGKPVVIVMPTVRGGGAIATSNYLARDLKIRSGMSLALAKKLSNEDTIFINADRVYYKEISKKVFEIIDFYCQKVEQVSIDEAYLDLTNPEGFEKAIDMCKKIQSKIFSDLKLTCSIGLSKNKLIAKMASNEKKPNGLTIILPEKINNFLENKKISKLYGIGPKSEEILIKENIKTIKELKKIELFKLIDFFGEKKGKLIYGFARGEDERAVNENREKKQISRLMTIKNDSLNFEEIKPTLELLSELVFNEAKKTKKSFLTCSIIIITKNFETFTKSKTINSILNLEEFKELEYSLLKDFLNENFISIRRIGVRVSNFDKDFGVQKNLFDFGV